ncbi:MAG: phytanoyl-CoA dioxygenase family protein [Ilumatobacteraceae bacterium]
MATVTTKPQGAATKKRAVRVGQADLEDTGARLETVDPSNLQAKPDRSASDYTSEHWAELDRLGLLGNIAELEAHGLTVIPPDKVAEPAFITRLRDAVVRVTAARTGETVDVAGTTEAVYGGGFGRQMFYLLFEDDVFQEAVLNPAALAMATYLLGESCIMSNCLAGLKGPGGGDLPMHCDNVMIPAPFPPYAQVCNVTWALTDYGPGTGELQYVPGSHRFGRHPALGEAHDDLVPVHAAAGSIIFWHGNTWHAALARTDPGLRINLIVAMMRPYLRPQEAYKENVTAEILAKNPPRFATLVGQGHNYSWKQEGPKPIPGSYLPGLIHQFD